MEAKERELWAQYQKSVDLSTKEQIKEKIVLYYLPVVKYLASRLAIHLPAGLGREDLESCGIMGLLEAINKFDPEKGVDFVDFARRRIKGAMIDEIRRLSWAPRRLWQQINKVEQAKKELALTEEEVNIQKIAAKTGFSPAEVKKINSYANQSQVISLDQENFAHVFFAFCTSEPDEIVIKKEKQQILARAISLLEERDRLLLALYYQEGLTLKEIGQVLKVTESRVCQLHAQAISRLRKKLEEFAYA